MLIQVDDESSSFLPSSSSFLLTDSMIENEVVVSNVRSELSTTFLSKFSSKVYVVCMYLSMTWFLDNILFGSSLPLIFVCRVSFGEITPIIYKTQLWVR
jgi:hypothetical protein